VDTARDARLGRVFMNRTIRVYPAFAEFYGMEENFRLADRIEDALGGRGVHQRVVAARLEILRERHLRVAACFTLLWAVRQNPQCQLRSTRDRMKLSSA
jgi:predicted GNAT family acetyltransferase